MNFSNGTDKCYVHTRFHEYVHILKVHTSNNIIANFRKRKSIYIENISSSCYVI